MSARPPATALLIGVGPDADYPVLMASCGVDQHADSPGPMIQSHVMDEF